MDGPVHVPGMRALEGVASTAIARLAVAGTARNASSGLFTEGRIAAKAALKNMHMSKSSNPAGGRV